MLEQSKSICLLFVLFSCTQLCAQVDDKKFEESESPTKAVRSAEKAHS